MPYLALFKRGFGLGPQAAAVLEARAQDKLEKGGGNLIVLFVGLLGQLSNRARRRREALDIRGVYQCTSGC